MDSGEYLAQIVFDDLIDRYDRHPYRPDFDLEHFAIECYKHGLSREMMKWREHYMHGTPRLRPFVRNISHEDAKKIDLMGNIPESMVRNEEFDQICKCTEGFRIQLQLSHYVPSLMNLAMYPVGETCRTCLRGNHRTRRRMGLAGKAMGRHAAAGTSETERHMQREP